MDVPEERVRPGPGSGVSTVAAASGLALSSWLAILKLGSLPCIGGGCESVIQSAYGSLLGVPVGVYAAALWLGAFLSSGRRIRLACLGILGLGSVVFIAIEALVLRSFCALCTAHALATGIAFLARRNPPRLRGLLAGLAIAAAALGWTLSTARSLPASGRPALSALAGDPVDAFYWLGPRDPGSPVLVLSLTCPACLDALGALARADLSRHSRGPALYFKADAAGLDATAVFIAAVLARDGNKRDAFLGMATLALTQRNLLLSDPRNAATVLRALLPGGTARESDAEAIIARQAKRLDAAGVVAVPLLISPDGTARTTFSPDAVFP